MQAISANTTAAHTSTPRRSRRWPKRCAIFARFLAAGNTENETVEYIDENPRNLDVKNLGVVSIPQPPSPSKQSRASSA